MRLRPLSALFVLLTLFILMIGCSDDDSSPAVDGGSSPDASLDATTDTGGKDSGTDTAPATYTVGGTVAGLAGTGLVLQDNAGDDLTVSANGAFTFKTAVAAGGAYDVTVLKQPTAPSQTCVATKSKGTVGAANVVDVAITCTTAKFTVGGTVTGLAGTGLVLQNNGGDNLTVAANGVFTFPASLASGGSLNVTDLTQPGAPAQTCAVSGGTGTVGAGNVTGVVVNCATSTFTVGGTISGLAGTVVLQNNAGDNLSVNANGSFAFATTVASGAPYAVTVLTQPSAPTQTCTVTAGSGTVAGANITSVRVACVTQTFTVGGNVTGLTGKGLVLQNNAGDNVTVSASGAFTFATSVASGGAYAVTVLTQPTAPSQTCTITNGTGTVGAANVTNVAVACTTQTFTVGGKVVGLAGTGMVIQNNGGDNLAITANGNFTFATHIASGAAYAVTILTQPSAPAQSCSISGGTGTIGSGNVTGVVVNCSTDMLTIGGTISGLAGTVVLQDNGGDNLTLNANGSFAFPTLVLSGGAYAVTVLTQPGAPAQTCTVSNGSGTVAAANISNVTVVCTTNQYTVGGSVSGLAGTGLVLRNNGGDSLTIAANGPFTFATSIPSGGTYSVTTQTQPTNLSQTCVVTTGSGTIAAANITTVVVTCTTNTYAVGGTVTGLAGSGLVLRDNGGDNLSISANGTFAFTTKIASGGAYAVTVLTQPSAVTQSCVVTAGTGSVVNADITSVVVTCTTTKFTVGGTVSGLAGSGLVLQNNLGNNFAVSANGPFTFTTSIASGSPYSVTILTQPSSPTQTCTVSGGSGTVGAANVTSVTVSCATNQFTVGGSVSGLAGTGLILQNNAGDNLSITANGAFAFATSIASGAAYAVTVQAQPSVPTQSCVVTNGTGTVGGGNVTSVTVTCTTTTFTIGGTVTGLGAGDSVVLRNNGADDLTVSGSTFTFATPIASELPYAVTVLTNPSAPIVQTCAVTNGSGTVHSANITSVTITCTTTKFTVGGSVSGLAGTGLVLQDNAGDNYSVAGNGPFTFATSVASGAGYAVTVLTQPSNLTQTCTVTNGSGTIGSANYTGVTVTCTTTKFTVGGSISGLTSGSVVLRDNGGDDLTRSTNGGFTFATSIASGSPYAVTVFTQPAGLLCGITTGSGTVTNANITTVSVTCGPAPTGGTITTSGGYRIHTFTSSGTFQSFTPVNVDYLVVAGGGGGGSGDGAGGGAGGMKTGSLALGVVSASVVVGGGGLGAGLGEIGSASTNGSDSSFSGVTSTGGGRGGQEDNTGGGGPLNLGGAGGSGGGFGGANSSAPAASGGAGSAGQGNNGGTRAANTYGMGGGGGAGSAGGNGSVSNPNQGGAGGVGLASSISGSSVFYAGGGGGSGRGTSGGAGGAGGGGNGGLNSSGTSATPNTGGGGGGGGDQGTTGGAGGSGIVIIRYLM